MLNPGLGLIEDVEGCNCMGAWSCSCTVFSLELIDFDVFTVIIGAVL
jgi:hypothetical protein